MNIVKVLCFLDPRGRNKAKKLQFKLHVGRYMTGSTSRHILSQIITQFIYVYSLKPLGSNFNEGTTLGYVVKYLGNWWSWLSVPDNELAKVFLRPNQFCIFNWGSLNSHQTKELLQMSRKKVIARTTVLIRISIP